MAVPCGDERPQNNRLIQWSVFHGPEYYGKYKIFDSILGRKINKGSRKKQSRGSLAEHINNDFKDHDTFLKNLDPKDWRKQDHYAVLGLKERRNNASEQELKKAHRMLVLKHHPDKRPAADRTKNDGDYFTCITRAWEVLGNKSTRRAYDSVDPYFDDSIPSSSTYTETEFFATFPSYFEKNSRWSEVQPVPLLGNKNSKREEVERFYNFWFNFHSWRDYSYDFEEQDTNMDRDERRYVEKQKKAERVKLKKAEMARIRKLVDLAYANDPRIKKFKMEEKEAKLAAKRMREEEARAKDRIAAQQAREIEEREKKKRDEEEAKKQKEQEVVKKEQAEMKKSLKKIKKNIWDLCAENNYYVKEGEDNVQHMTYIEQICSSFTLENLDKFYKSLCENGRDAFLKTASDISEKIKQERESSISAAQKQAQNAASSTKKAWSPKELQLLIKAVNLYPAGTDKRWEVIAEFIMQHCENGVVRSVREIMNKAKEMQKMRINQKSEEAREVINMTNPVRSWTQVEQKLLEEGLRLHSSTVNDRWERIAIMIPSRTKEEVQQRYKELVESIKARRNAKS